VTELFDGLQRNRLGPARTRRAHPPYRSALVTSRSGPR
jgi:hypothetical protein